MKLIGLTDMADWYSFRQIYWKNKRTLDNQNLSLPSSNVETIMNSLDSYFIIYIPKCIWG